MTNPLNNLVKRANPDSQNAEEVTGTPIPISVSRATSVAESVSISRELSTREDSTHKSKVYVVSPRKTEPATTPSKTQDIAMQMLSSPTPAAAMPSAPAYGYSTPPSKNLRRVSFSPSPTSEKGSPRIKETKLSTKAHEIAKVEIEKSKAGRKNKLQALSPGMRTDIEAFEKELQAIGDLVLAIWELHKELHEKNSQLFELEGTSPATAEEEEKVESKKVVLTNELETGEEQLKGQTELLEEKIGKISEKFKELKKSDFSSFLRSNTTHKENLPLLKDMLFEQLINKLINCLHFRNRIINDIEKYKTQIIHEFYRRDFDSSFLREVTFEPVFSSSETHNRGEIATKIEFFQKDRPIFVVYYKPRDARIDAAIINLFKEVNRLSDNQKSSIIPLPEYKILSVATESEFFSIWEYIDGKPENGEANIVIDNLVSQKKISLSQETILRQQLRRLESLCHAIHLSDLHSENVLFRFIGTDHPEIVPIDLESIQEDAETGLYRGRAPETHLSSAETELVDKFCGTVSSTPFRLVALATGEFLGCLNEPTFYEKVSDALIRRLESLEYRLTCPKEEILRLVVEDYLNHDIPYLIKHDGRLFYGPLRLQKNIAVKNK